MIKVRVIVEYTDGTKELVTMIGDFESGEIDPLHMVELKLKETGRYEKVIAMKVKE